MTRLRGLLVRFRLVPAAVAFLVEGTLTMMPLTRFKLAVALVLVVGLVAIEVGVRAWKGGAAAAAKAPLPHQGLVKRSLAPGEAPPPPLPPSVAYIGPSEVDFVGAKTLNEALELVRRELILDDKADFAALLSEERVCKALQAGTAAYEAILVKSK